MEPGSSSLEICAYRLSIWLEMVIVVVSIGASTLWECPQRNQTKASRVLQSAWVMMCIHTPALPDELPHPLVMGYKLYSALISIDRIPIHDRIPCHPSARSVAGIAMKL